MSPSSQNNRHLHFIVRSNNEDYDYAPGYGHFLNYVLQALNQHTPKTAEDMLNVTMELMRNNAGETLERKSNIKNPETLKHCLPLSLQKYANIPSCPQRLLFGPVIDDDFGSAFNDVLDRSQNYRGWEDSSLRITGDALITPISSISSSSEGREGYRAYWDTFCKNARLTASIPDNYAMQFDYPIPHSTERIKLMSIGTRSGLRNEYNSRFDGDPKILENYFTAPFAGEYYIANRYTDQFVEKRDMGKKVQCAPSRRHELIFLHPNCDREHFVKLTKCINPLLKEIDSPDSDLETKQSAMAEAYWLLAQSTPVWRGGSAYARVLLEHMSDRIRDQGYDYVIPFTKNGVDLWAEAVTMKVQDFKNAFKDGIFFDTQVTEAEVEKSAIENSRFYKFLERVNISSHGGLGGHSHK